MYFGSERKLFSFSPTCCWSCYGEKGSKVRTEMELKLGNGPDGLAGFYFLINKSGRLLICY